MTKVVDYFKESYRLSPFAFYCEILEAILLIIGSAVLSFSILDPNTKVFVPLYLVGSILGLISTYIRKSSAVVLISWFVAMNFWAFIQLFIL